MTPEEITHRLSVLLTEYQRVYTEIMDMQRKSDSLAGLGVTGVGAGLLVGLRQEAPGILPVTTLFATILVLYIILCYSVILSLGGYKQYLEHRINTLTDAEVLKWESHITQNVLHNAWQMKCMFGVLLALPCLLFVTSLYVGQRPVGLLLVMYFLMFAGLFYSCCSAGLRLTKMSSYVRGVVSSPDDSGSL